MLLINRFLLLYGDEQAVAVYGCIGYITAILYLLLQGVGDGSQPLISQYYGRDDRSSVQVARKLAYLTAAAITAVCTIGVYLARAKVGTLFGASTEANAGVIRYLPLFSQRCCFWRLSVLQHLTSTQRKRMDFPTFSYMLSRSARC